MEYAIMTAIFCACFLIYRHAESDNGFNHVLDFYAIFIICAILVAGAWFALRALLGI